MMKYKILDYSKVRPEISSGDILLFRPSSTIGRIISALSPSDYCHTERAIVIHGALCSVGMDWGGGRILPLSHLVHKHPGQIDWYRASAYAESQSELILRACTFPYGYRTLIRFGITRLVPGIRLPQLTPNLYRFPPVCSQLIVWLDRQSGYDSVPGIPDNRVEPWHLAAQDVRATELHKKLPSPPTGFYMHEGALWPGL